MNWNKAERIALAVLLGALVLSIWLTDRNVFRLQAEMKAMAEASRQTCVCSDGFFP